MESLNTPIIPRQPNKFTYDVPNDRVNELLNSLKLDYQEFLTILGNLYSQNTGVPIYQCLLTMTKDTYRANDLFELLLQKNEIYFSDSGAVTVSKKSKLGSIINGVKTF